MKHISNYISISQLTFRYKHFLYMYIKISIVLYIFSRAKSTSKNFHKTTISNGPFRTGKTASRATVDGGWEMGVDPKRSLLYAPELRLRRFKQ